MTNAALALLPTYGWAQEAALSAALAGHAVKANIKITNPIKVPCVVNLSVAPRGADAGKGGKAAPAPAGKGAAGGKGGEAVPGFPMEVQPAQLVIPPLEYRWVGALGRRAGWAGGGVMGARQRRHVLARAAQRVLFRPLGRGQRW